MPTYEIGGQMFETDDVLSSAELSSLADTVDPPSEALGGVVNAVQGYLGGWVDELAGPLARSSGAYTPAPVAVSDEALTQEVRRADTAFDEQNPVTSLALNMGGAVAGLSPLGAAKTGLGRLGVGTGTAAITGAGESREGERLTGGLQGAASGAVIGSLGEAVVAIGKRVIPELVRGGKDFIANQMRSSESRHAHYVNQMFADLGVDVDKIRAGVGREGHILANADEGLSAAAEVTSREATAPRARQLLQVMDDVDATVERALVNKVDDAVGSPDTAAKLRERLLNARQKGGDRLYELADKLPAPGSLLKTWRQVALRGKAWMAEINQTLSDRVFNASGGAAKHKNLTPKRPPSTVGEWRQVYQKLRDQAQTKLESQDAKDTAAGHAMKVIANGIRDALNKHSPEFKAGQAFFQSTRHDEELIEFGKLMSHGSPGKITEAFSKLKKGGLDILDLKDNPYQRQLLMAGLSEGIEEATQKGSASDLSALAQVINQTKLQGTLKKYLGSDTGDQVFALADRALKSRATTARIRQATTAGLRKQVGETFTGGVGSADNLLAVARKTFGRAPAEVIDNVSDALTSLDPAAQSRLLDLVRKQNPKAFAGLLRLGWGARVMPPATGNLAGQVGAER